MKEMNIIFIDWNSFCNEDVIDALKGTGHNVRRIKAEKNEWFSSWSTVEELFDSIDNIKSYDLVFSMSYFPNISNYCKEQQLKYISWVYDNPCIHVYSYTIINSNNYVFIFDYHMYQELHRAGIKTVYYMPMAVNTERLEKLFNKSNSHRKYKADISFVGSLYSQGKNNLTLCDKSVSLHEKQREKQYYRSPPKFYLRQHKRPAWSFLPTRLKYMPLVFADSLPPALLL